MLYQKLIKSVDVRVNASSSKGNNYVYGNFMIDLGVAYDLIAPHLKYIDYILISHKHQDHYNKQTLKTALYKFNKIKVFSSPEMIEIIKNDMPDYIDRIFPINPNQVIAFKNGDKLSCFELPHDPELVNYGFRLKIGACKIIHMTDCGDISHISFKGYDFALIEANYSEQVINANIAKVRTDGDWWLYKHLIRVKTTHLALHQCNEAIDKYKPAHYFKGHGSSTNLKRTH